MATKRIRHLAVLRQYSNRSRFTHADVPSADRTRTACVRITPVPIAIGEAQRSDPRQRLPFARLERNESTFTAPAVVGCKQSSPRRSPVGAPSHARAFAKVILSAT
jgi:hypothetical protein